MWDGAADGAVGDDKFWSHPRANGRLKFPDERRRMGGVRGETRGRLSFFIPQRTRPMSAIENVLVVNSGSSSLKFTLYRIDGEKRLANGLVERIGSDNANMVYRREIGRAHV